MRHVWTLVVLGLMMALFHRLTSAGPLEARATLALGFLLLAAHVGGALAKRIGLPRITGYLLTGFVMGPAWLGLVRAEEVEILRFISDAAVALIAFAAGTELKIEMLREQRRALSKISLAAIAFPFGTVSVAILALSPWFPLTINQGLGDAIAVALVLGTVAAASSPSVTMALIDELDARGPFARTLLSVTIVKDVAVVVLLTLLLAVVRPLVSQGALQTSAAWAALGHVLGSVAAGSVVGYFVAQYLRVVHRDTPLFLVAVSLLTAEMGRLLGLEAMLVALAAGFYVENFSRVEGERLVLALGRGSLPVYVVFFALAGAGLHLDALSELWFWALLLVGLRAFGLWRGLRWAGRAPLVTHALARHGWWGLISQAGMALGLATVARRAFPEWGVSLEALIVSMIAVHELVGPVCLRRALILVGEAKEGTHVPERAGVERNAVPLPGGGL